MPRVAIVVALLFGLLIGGGGAFSALSARAPVTDEAAVRGIVAEMLDARDAAMEAKGPMNVPALDTAELNPLIEDYLISNPRILQRMSNALEIEVRTAEAAAAKEAIGKLSAQIFDDPDHIVIGNPEGDVTLVEMFDYNCGYCRSALPDLATLIAEDPNLKVVLKEFPILSQESVDAARIGILVAESDVDYWAFHQALFTSRGQVNKETALAAARDLGLNPVTLAMDMQSPEVSAILQKSYDIATGLKVSGTPTYIIGDELIPGAIGIDQLRERIANMRECGKTDCNAPS